MSKKQNENVQAEQKLVEVTLAKPHEHAGVKYKAGDKIKVNEPDRDWLVRNAIASA
jgi:hypothetical protein